MSKGSVAKNVLEFLSKYGSNHAYPADIARFGPEAPKKLRALLDFLPTMSDDARAVSGDAWLHSGSADHDDAWKTSIMAAKGRRAAPDGSTFVGTADGDGMSALRNAQDAAQALGGVLPFSPLAAGDAATGLLTSRFIDPQTYRVLTLPLATGRALDVVRPHAPENFLDVVRGLGERGLVQQPVDMISAQTLAIASDPERKYLMEVINAIAGDTGYADTSYDSLTELISAARLLG
jgi:hypothetical protein